MTWPLAAVFAQFSSSPQPSSSASQQSSSQPSSTQAQPPSQAHAANPTSRGKKKYSLAEAARKAKAKKRRRRRASVLPKMICRTERPRRIRVGDAPRKARARAADGSRWRCGENSEEYWRGRAQDILGQIAAVDQAIAGLKEDIKKYGSGGFDVTTGMKDNIAYINDRNGQLKNLEKRKADLESNWTSCRTRVAKRERRFLVPLSARGASRSRRTPRNAQLRSRERINFCARKETDTKTAPRTSSFGTANAYADAIAGLNPWLWERTRVLRPLWTELPAQTVRVHSM